MRIGSSGKIKLTSVMRWMTSSVYLPNHTPMAAKIMVARVEPTVRAKLHEHVKLAMNPERLHFFDTKTEQAI